MKPTCAMPDMTDSELPAMKRRLKRPLGSKGQSIVEFAIVLPLTLLISMGVIEVSWALIDLHTVTRLAREGSNLISRDTKITQASATLQSMSSAPVDFNSDSTVIFSVIEKVAQAGAANNGFHVLSQRRVHGSLGGVQSVIRASAAGSGSCGSAATDYSCPGSSSNTGLRVTGMPAGINLADGGFLYVTEIYSSHPLISPFDRLGVSIPTTLYSIAYF